MNRIFDRKWEAAKAAALLYPDRPTEDVVAGEAQADRKLMITAAAAGLIFCILTAVFKGLGSEAAAVLILAAVGTGAVPALRVQRRRQALAGRKLELETDFSDLTAKLSVLIGAGMSVRSALEKLISDYRRDLSEGRQLRRFLYEEIDLALRLMKQGHTEEEALTRLGERLELPCYLRLVNLLVSEQKRGMTELKKALSLEAREAFEGRLTIARRQGEKISSRLLLPMIALFGMVVLILIIPAFMRW